MMRLVAALIPVALLLAVACGDGTSTPQLPSPTTVAGTPDPTQIPLPTTTVQIDDREITVEVANTPAARTRGLGYRDSLPEDAGMLFGMGAARLHRFWMKGMRFPLDMVWIDEQKQVISVTRDVPAEPPGTPDSELPTYAPDEPALYVLELNAGAAERLGIDPADRLEFTLP